jgi:hypothetical protein
MTEATAHPAIELTTCRNFEEIVCDAYKWLSYEYSTGNCIFLFGAYTWVLNWGNLALLNGNNGSQATREAHTKLEHCPQ